MKATISEDKRTIILPVPLGSAVFIIKYNQHDGYYPEVCEYSYSTIQNEIYLTRSEVDAAIYALEK